MIFPIDKIKIKDGFLEREPNAEKLNAARKYYEEHGTVNHKIVLNENNYLVDGYIAYLVLKENHVNECEISYDDCYRNKETLYIYGKHLGKSKELVWRIPAGKKNKAYQEIKIGDKVLVSAKSQDTGKNKILPIIVTRMALLNEAPRPGYIKRVVAWNLDEMLEEMTV